MKTWLLAMAMAAGLVACGGSSGGNGGGGAGGGGGSSSSSSQTCDEQHQCVNGSCECTAGPKKNNSCCDPNDDQCTSNKCDSYCKYCQ